MTTPRRRHCQEGFLRVTLLLSLAGLRLDLEPAPPASRGLSGKQDGATAQQPLWLQEVRALGTPRFPATRVVAWLVQDGGEAPPPPAGAASAGSSSLEEAPEPPFSGRRGQHLQQQQSSQGGAAPIHGGSSQCSGEEEEHLFGNLVPVNSEDVNLPIFNSTIDLTQAISHNVSLQDAMMETDHTATVNAERNLEIQDTLSLNSSLTYSNTSLINATNLLGIFASDNGYRNLTSQDFFIGMDACTSIDEITSLATEENSNPMETTSLFEEPDYDSAFNLDHSSTSFALTCDTDAESASCDILGAIGGSCLEYSKNCHMDYQCNYDLSAESLVDVFHNHTYNQIPHHLAPSTSEHCYPWPEKSHKVSSRNIEPDRNQNQDECRAKALRIPFSVNDIITMPVDSYNSMLSRYYLTDNQLSLIRDIRRRGKNKVAAQNCRKRKLNEIMNLEDDVCHLQAKKESLKKEKAQCNRLINFIKQKLDALSWDIFSRLRDDQGRPVNPNQYTLHCCKNGSVLVLPGTAVKLEPKQETPQNKK